MPNSPSEEVPGYLRKKKCQTTGARGIKEKIKDES